MCRLPLQARQDVTRQLYFVALDGLVVWCFYVSLHPAWTCLVVYKSKLAFIHQTPSKLPALCSLGLDRFPCRSNQGKERNKKAKLENLTTESLLC